MDVQCIFVDPATSRISLKLGSKILTGTAKLTQIVVLSLLNTPGKDVLSPGDGGGIPALVGSNFDPTDPDEVFAEVARCVNKSQTEIINAQIGLQADPAELLRALHIVSIKPGDQLDRADATIRIISENGTIQDVVL